VKVASVEVSGSTDCHSHALPALALVPQEDGVQNAKNTVWPALPMQLSVWNLDGMSNSVNWPRY
jgi:hypothetical protein